MQRPARNSASKRCFGYANTATDTMNVTTTDHRRAATVSAEDFSETTAKMLTGMPAKDSAEMLATIDQSVAKMLQLLINDQKWRLEVFQR